MKRATRCVTLSHPRCVWNLLKKHVERYTPEMVNRLCGTSLADFNRICEILASTSVPDRTATILYALGWTHHSAGAQIIRAAAMPQLLLGNIGMAGGGVNARSLQYSGLYRPWPAVDQSARLYAAAVGKTAGLSDLYFTNHPACAGGE
jgi:anaerobic selenocysteine-containing dehydrogenase